MAERRMFTKKITDDDKFMELSASAQALYLHLSMSADDDGFCSQVTVCMFRAHASTHDLESLIENCYVMEFDDGVIVIKHWRMANALRKDRYTPTIYQKELSMLDVAPNGEYVMKDGCQLVAERLPVGCQVVATGKDRLDKESIGKDSLEEDKKKKRFTPPTLEELQSFIIENNFTVDPQQFIDYYSSNGWMVGKTHMKDWKATVRNWQRREKERYPRRKPTRVVDLPDWYNANPQRVEEGDKASADEVQAMRELLARGKNGAEN